MVQRNLTSILLSASFKRSFFSGKSLKSTATHKTGASGASTVKSKNTMKAGLAVETMSAPNPFCPDTKVITGVCECWHNFLFYSISRRYSDRRMKV